MKKTIIIALLAVLVLGVFTACNGDVNAELAGSRTITLEIVASNPDNWTFDKGTTSLVVAIPEGCETWGDLVGKISITITNGDDTKTLPLTSNDLGVSFFVSVGEYYYFGYVNPNAKWTPPETVQNNTSIALGKTYELRIFNGSSN